MSQIRRTHVFQCLTRGVIRYKVSGYPMNEPVVDWIDVIIAPHEREAARAFWKEALTSREKSLMGDWEYTNGRWSELTSLYT